MSVQELLSKFHDVAAHPRKQMDAYIAEGRQVVLTVPYYAPEEIVHAMGLIPMGVWGGDLPLQKSKEYFPAFICSVLQSILELGMSGTYDGASALIVPSLCDSLKCLGQNWKYAVPAIAFIPMTCPQNRDTDEGRAFIRAGYERVAAELEQAAGARLDDAALARSIQIYNAHNAAMRELDEALAHHPELSAAARSDIYKSAFFLEKGEHTTLVRQLLAELKNAPGTESKLPVMTSGILCDAPGLLEIFDDLGLQIVADDVTAESRQYRTDAPEAPEALSSLDALAEKFARTGSCSVLYDVEKKRAKLIVDTAKARGAKGLVLVLTKFCDPEEFDYVIIKKACQAAGLPVVLLEADRQMSDYGQARTALETFRDIL